MLAPMLSFTFGVVTSLLATAIWVIAIYIRRTLAIRDLSGVWIEVRHAACPNPENVCFFELSYPFFDNSGYRIEGSVYTKELRRVARWTTMSCAVDQNLARIVYFYSGSLTDSPFVTIHGFGLINLGEFSKRTLMKDGYFLDANQAGTPPSTCDYIHISSIPGLEVLTSLGDLDFAVENLKSPLRERVERVIAERQVRI